jgi:hypothetical protein
VVSNAAKFYFFWRVEGVQMWGLPRPTVTHEKCHFLMDMNLLVKEIIKSTSNPT